MIPARHNILLFLIILTISTTAFARPYTNWPTYASAPLQNWPKATEYNKLVEDFQWINKALNERRYAAGYSPYYYAQPTINGTTLPRDTVKYFKDGMRDIPKYFVDTMHFFTTGENFLNYLAVNYPIGSNPYITFPMFTNILTDLYLPTNYYTYTPKRCFNGISPIAGDENYGTAGIKEIADALKITSEGTGYWKMGLASAGICSQGNHTTWVEAKQDAESSKKISSGNSYIHTYGNYNTTLKTYTAQTIRGYGYLAGEAATNVARKGLFFVCAIPVYWAGWVFDGNGDVEEGWNFFPGAGDANTKELSILVGDESLSQPNWCDAPSPTDTSTDRGYIISRDIGDEHETWILWDWDFQYTLN